MDSNRSFDIETTRLKVGTILEFDLTDSSGRVILEAGRPFDESIRQLLLSSGIEKLTIRLETRAVSASQILLDSYPPESVARLQQMLSATEESLDAFSIYPIGTEVEMSDSRPGIVIRTNPGRPLEPVVRFLDGPHDIADLVRTDLQILAPATVGKGLKRLDPKKEMLRPLWNATTDLDFFQ